MDWDRWPNFSEDEMRCKETGELDMDESFMDKLQSLRSILHRPVKISSGFRSVKHSAEVNKANGGGSHTHGVATDISVSGGQERYEVLKAAVEAGMTGIGIHKDFIHVDGMVSRPEAPRPAAWPY